MISRTIAGLKKHWTHRCLSQHPIGIAYGRRVDFSQYCGKSLLTAAESVIGIAMRPNWLSIQSSNKANAADSGAIPMVHRPRAHSHRNDLPNVQKPPRNVRAVMDYFMEQYESDL
ncbi:hypothetical protein [Neisseria yangbaofengii]|uniref:hypothetical protein n=1 Tax=Neisseria yangbaofengii TaxID=2709396 RepID=UPI0013EC5377|nr:hypothetical protein [Neisseria yangbaofengii]